jgi:hypothetical protein
MVAASRIKRQGAGSVTAPFCSGIGAVHNLAKVGVEGSNPFARSKFPSRKLISYEKVAARRPSSFLAWCPHGVHRDVEAPTNPLCGRRPRIPWSSESSGCRLGSRSDLGTYFVPARSEPGVRGDAQSPL